MSGLRDLRQRFARAVERGDNRLGLFVGIGASILVAAAFVRPDVLLLPQRLEWTVLDYLGFRSRAPIEEAPDVAVIDIDESTAKKFAWPLDRSTYAKAILALDELGARQTVFDVEFKMTIPEKDRYDPETGAFRLRPSDRFLRTAIAASGKVTLGYHVDLEDYLAPLRPWSEPLKAAFARHVGAGVEEIARESGAPEALLREQFEGVREEFVALAVADRLDRRPDLTFAKLREELLPGELARGTDLHLVHYAYWFWKSRRLMAEKAARVEMQGRPPKVRHGAAVVPPAYPFLEAAAGVGCTVSDPDTDGVMRRPYAVLLHGGTAHAYLGLAAAAREGEGLALDAGSVRVRRDGREIPLQVDEEGRLLVNWAGNARRGRLSTYAHVPLVALVNYFDLRHQAEDENARATIAGLKPPFAEEYVRLSDRLAAAVEGKVDLEPVEYRTLVARLRELRGELAAGMEREDAQLAQALERLTSPRARARPEEARRNIARQLAGLRVADAIGAELRPLLGGKICVIGSSYTASGDLHVSPLGKNTPGVDVPVNVAGMALTGRSIRKAPAWLNLVYLLAVGVLVSAAVGHWGTAASTLFTAAVAGASLGVFALLFSTSGLLVTGAGPATTALVAFASVTAFKELVTQRSKRKLQQELEKNTSPELVKILMEHPEFLSRPRKMEGTFFFSDVKSFTSISEKMSADVLFPFINRYLDAMTRVLKVRLAYLDKYIGDGIMALFGVPVASSDHARNACRAALECQEALAALNVEFAKEGHPQLKSRIGLNSGEVSAGYMGAHDRSDYSVLGDAVNLAARLEGANKEYGTAIMLSEATRVLVGDAFVVRELDRIRVVGKRVPTGIYELIAPAGAPLPFPPAFLPAYDAALAAYKARRWTEAREGFRAALALRPGDRPCEVYIERCEAFQAAPPPGDWEGVFELTSK